MARQIVMDPTGDAKYEFNPADAAAVQEAEVNMSAEATSR